MKAFKYAVLAALAALVLLMVGSLIYGENPAQAQIAPGHQNFATDATIRDDSTGDTTIFVGNLDYDTVTTFEYGYLWTEITLQAHFDVPCDTSTVVVTRDSNDVRVYFVGRNTTAGAWTVYGSTDYTDTLLSHSYHVSTVPPFRYHALITLGEAVSTCGTGDAQGWMRIVRRLSRDYRRRAWTEWNGKNGRYWRALGYHQMRRQT